MVTLGTAIVYLNVLINDHNLMSTVAVEVSIADTGYEFAESADTVDVCAILTAVPTQGLDCSIVATLLPADGIKAGECARKLATFLIPFLRTYILYNPSGWYGL